MSPDKLFAIAVIWLFIGGIIATATADVLTEYRNKTSQQVFALGLGLLLVVPLVILFWVGYGIVSLFLFISTGIAEWKRDLFPRSPKIAPIDPILEAAKREVEQIAPEHPDA